jgi:DNA-binding response OmpR family regulator
MKILVIDDEKPTLSMFRLFLTAYGYEVVKAEDGEKGLALFHEIRHWLNPHLNILTLFITAKIGKYRLVETLNF